jgi:hypothetical protein
MPSNQAEGYLTPKIQRAIEYYLDTRDLAKAAVLAGIDPKDFTRVAERDEVKAEIDRRLEIEHAANAEVRAKARKLTRDFLDDQLITAVKAGSEKGDTKALELGYERLGLRRDDNFMTEAQSTPQERPREMYRVLRQQTVTTTEVQQIEGGAPASPALPAPPTLEGSRKPAEPLISMDIEEY